MQGIILAAGYGVRFLPITKVLPKELLPLRERPAIDYIIDEFVRAGINDLIIVLSPRKRLIRNYYRPIPWLERHLIQSGKTQRINTLKLPAVNIRFIYQRVMRGTGQALLQASRYFSGPAVVAYPDDVHWGNPPLVQQLITAGSTSNKSVLATIHNPPHPERYGIIACRNSSKLVEDIIEKPPPDKLPSRYASIGRFLYQPQFFEFLKEGWQIHRRAHPHNEYYHIYALKKLIKMRKVIHHPVEGEMLDIGEPAGYVKSIARLSTLIPPQ